MTHVFRGGSEKCEGCGATEQEYVAGVVPNECRGTIKMAEQAMNHEFRDGDSHCAKCLVTHEMIEDGLAPESCPGVPWTAHGSVIRGVCTTCGTTTKLMQRGKPCIKVAKAADFTDTRPADVRVRANGPWVVAKGVLSDADLDAMRPTSVWTLAGVERVSGLASAQRKHITDDAWAATMRSRWAETHRYKRNSHEEANAEIGIVLISVAEHDALTANRSRNADVEMCEILGRQLRASMATTKRANDSEADWRQIADARQVGLEAALKRIAVLEASQDGEAQGQIEHLDRENARLRRDLIQAGRELSGLRPLVRMYNADREKSKASNGVISVDPFSDVKAVDDTWPPPAHRPRMLP